MLVELPLAMIEAGTAVTVTAAALPTVNITAVEPCPVPEPALTTAVPASVELVSTTVATPLALAVDVKLDSVPDPVVQDTGAPATRLPWASLTVADKVLVDVPLAVIEVGEAETTTAVAVPAVNATTAEPLAEPEEASTVALPTVVELVSTTVATPLVWVMVEPLANVPADVSQATGTP